MLRRVGPSADAVNHTLFYVSIRCFARSPLCW